MVLYIIKAVCFFRRRDSLSQLRVERRWFELASKGDLEGKKEKRKKAMVLSFYDSYFGDRFRPEKTVGPEQGRNNVHIL